MESLTGDRLKTITLSFILPPILHTKCTCLIFIWLYALLPLSVFQLLLSCAAAHTELINTATFDEKY